MERCETAPGKANLETTVWAVAPGRINLIGEHIDYLGGKVMPAAIDRHIAIEATPIFEDFCEVTTDFGGEERKGRIEFSDLRPRVAELEKWLNYFIGILHFTSEEGSRLSGFSARISSDLPPGAGLSSSAALETAFSLVLDSIAGVERTVLQRARLCQRAEHEFAGVPCGIMDQIAVGAGRAGTALCLDCDKEEWSEISLPSSWALLIADTGVQHSLGDGEYRKRREQCDRVLQILEADSFLEFTQEDLERNRDALGDLLFRRARHAVSEMERVDLLAEALEKQDAKSAGHYLRASHESLRDDYEVSCAELDALVDSAYEFGSERGLIGSRMTGGGFGGSTISLVEQDSAALLQEYLRKNYSEKFGRELNCFITRLVDGASVGPVQPQLVTL